MTNPTDLTGYAARLLVGTGLDPDQAARAAAGQSNDQTPATAALRDGWTAPERAATPAINGEATP